MTYWQELAIVAEATRDELQRNVLELTERVEDAEVLCVALGDYVDSIIPAGMQSYGLPLSWREQVDAMRGRHGE